MSQEVLNSAEATLRIYVSTQLLKMANVLIPIYYKVEQGKTSMCMGQYRASRKTVGATESASLSMISASSIEPVLENQLP